MTKTIGWSLPFLDPSFTPVPGHPSYALIILNQPFSFPLVHRLWDACIWRCCADGGANRLHDTLNSRLQSEQDRDLRSFSSLRYIPDLIKGDLDSLRDDVREFYAALNVPITRDSDQYATDLMKCIHALVEKEKADRVGQYDLVILGGLSGRLDQTVHTLSFVHKLRKTRKRTFAITDDNIAWVLDEGEHRISVNHGVLGPTCGLLPVGVDSAIISTTGLRWNLSDSVTSFDGLVSTSNHLVPEENTVCIKTTKPIWWSIELRAL
ncbi:hypothetical protein AcW1_008271 [Taiwanofungus camphoratus]|nr:hypothetical protein AcW1_008271 [Antrodia cinnamomea]